MPSFPRLAAQRRALLWFFAIGALLLSAALVLPSLVLHVRRAQAQEELNDMARLLEKLRELHGYYPAVFTNDVLLGCFQGRRNLSGVPATLPRVMDLVVLRYADADPDTPGNRILDPWGRPYVYRPRGVPWGSGYFLLSMGPDGKCSEPTRWQGQNGLEQVDADNLVITR